MKYLRIYENFEVVLKIASDLEDILHILQDEGHQVKIVLSKSLPYRHWDSTSTSTMNNIYLYVTVKNYKQIREDSFDEISSRIDDPDDFSELEIEEDVINRIMD